MLREEGGGGVEERSGVTYVCSYVHYIEMSVTRCN